jgi:hypothetical protein
MDDMRLLSALLATAFGLIPLTGFAAAPAPRPTSIPVLMTESGRNYVDVKILKFDFEGPIFRHQGGIAKIPYTQIKEKTRTLLGYPMAAEKPKSRVDQPDAGAPEPGPTFIPIRITTHWVLYAPASAPRWNPFTCQRAAWPFEDPFRPFAAVDFLVTGGVVPHPGWPGPNWIW